MDVNLTVGGTNEFNVPSGKGEKAWEFSMPVTGRLLGFSGHLHDYGKLVRLEDVESGKVIAIVTATRTTDGKVLKLSRSLPGVSGDGILLKSGRKYRVVGVYDNPAGQPVNSAMAHMSGIFARRTSASGRRSIYRTPSCRMTSRRSTRPDRRAASTITGSTSTSPGGTPGVFRHVHSSRQPFGRDGLPGRHREGDDAGPDREAEVGGIVLGRAGADLGRYPRRSAPPSPGSLSFRFR